MKRHPSFYAPHSKARPFATEQGIYRGSNEVYLKVNPIPLEVDPELHLSNWAQQASVLFWITKRKPKPSAAAGSAQQHISSINILVLPSVLTSCNETNPVYNTSPLKTCSACHLYHPLLNYNQRLPCLL